MRLSFQIDEQLSEQLRYIEQNLIDNAAKKALTDIARPVRDAVRAAAPDDTGELRRAIGQSTELNRRRHIAVVYVGLNKKNNPGWLTTRALAMEYGNLRVSPQPYLAKAANLKRRFVRTQFLTFLDKHLDNLIDQA